jgi:uncharacterized membrane protein ArfB
MDFVIQWLWYLLAFVAGSAVAWVTATGLIKRAAAKKVLAGLADEKTGARQ